MYALRVTASGPGLHPDEQLFEYRKLEDRSTGDADPVFDFEHPVIGLTAGWKRDVVTVGDETWLTVGPILMTDITGQACIICLREANDEVREWVPRSALVKMPNKAVLTLDFQQTFMIERFLAPFDDKSHGLAFVMHDGVWTEARVVHASGAQLEIKNDSVVHRGPEEAHPWPPFIYNTEFKAV